MQYPAPLTNAKGPPLRVRQIAQPPVSQHSSLRLPRRARGIDDVGQVVGRDRADGIVVRFLGNRGPVGVEKKHIRHPLLPPCTLPPCIPLPQMLLGQEDGYLSILDHKRQPILWIRWIQRQVGSTGLKDAQDAGHHLQRPFRRDAYQHLRPHPQLLQIVGQLIRLAVQFPVCQPSPLKRQRHRIRSLLHLGFEQVMDTCIPWKVRRGPIPIDERGTSLRHGQDWQSRNTPVRVSDDATQ